MKKLGIEILESCVDMDFMDYIDNQQMAEYELNELVSDLEVLEKYGNGSLVNAIRTMLMIME